MCAHDGLHRFRARQGHIMWLEYFKRVTELTKFGIFVGLLLQNQISVLYIKIDMTEI